MKKLVKLALVVGGVAVASKVAGAKRAEWQGLTEPQVREKMDARLPQEMPEDKRQMVIDKVVSGLRDRGMLGEEPAAGEGAETTA